MHALAIPEGSHLHGFNDWTWWLPGSLNPEPSFESVVEMPLPTFTTWLSSLSNCVNCNDAEPIKGSRYDLFPVEYGDVTHLEVIAFNEGQSVVIRIVTIYT